MRTFWTYLDTKRVSTVCPRDRLWLLKHSVVPGKGETQQTIADNQASPSEQMFLPGLANKDTRPVVSFSFFYKTTSRSMTSCIVVKFQNTHLAALYSGTIMFIKPLLLV